MKIIYVTAQLPHGCDEAFIVPEINQLMRSGHQVLVIPRSPRGRVLHGQDLLPFSRLASLFSPDVLLTAASSTLRTPGRVAEAIRLTRGGRSRAIDLKNLTVVAKAVWLAEIALAWEADHIHSHWGGTTATMAMLASHVSGIPWSLTAHRWDIVEDNLLAAKASSASFVRFISEDGLRMARSLGIGNAGTSRVLHMGVPLPGSSHGRPPRRRVVLCPARLVAVKGHRFLLESWRLLRSRGINAELWLAGDGNLRRELERLSNTLGIGSSVKFLGAIEHGKLLELYEKNAISVVVLASVDLGFGNREGIPVCLIEAMSYAVPVVATATGGASELVVPGTGLLVAPEGSHALANGIENFLENDELGRQVGNAGRARIDSEYNIVGVIGELVSAFQSAACRPAATRCA